MKTLIRILLSLLCISFINPLVAKDRYTYLYKDLPFEMPVLQRPEFPDTSVSLLDYNGVGDGKTLNTEAFAKAMEALEEKGGGVLVVPSGIWFTGPIIFKSNINLHLEKGALLLFSSDFNLYPLINTVFEGLNTRRCQSPISGINLENIAITGEGSINGAGEAWRPLKKMKVTDRHWNSVVKSGGVLKEPGYWFPTESALRGEQMYKRLQTLDLSENDWTAIKDYLRPVMISFIGCKNLLLEGVTFENSPSWNIHPLMCENVIIDNIFVKNPAYSQNGDGIDLESCKNSLIVNSMFDVGDDAICMKSGKDEDGRRRGMATENVIVDNCKVFKGHGGFVVGSEMSGGVRNIMVSNCQFMGTDVGLRFKSARGRGGVVENIYIQGINMFDIATESFLFDLYYGGKPAALSSLSGDMPKEAQHTPSADETTPVFRNIFVRDLVSRNARRAMFFNGLPEMNIENIRIENATITSEVGAEISESKNIWFNNVSITPKNGPALLLNNVKDMEVNTFFYPQDNGLPVTIQGDKNKNICLPKSMEAHFTGNKN